jgi:small subunit ribosomal protein S3e
MSSVFRTGDFVGLRGQRAKAMEFGDGYMIKTGHAGQVYTDTAV